ncbi:four-carbon acid sugar kinase family protein [Puniceibacterium sediminis]|uniref:Uncharacterized conserved protein YgbK, DUF1537 family n=1 Tax=Puniceibacterium sediminis TaxID=1608407 RepID=A0A238XE91_9RHOB|nr:four-carbon acid sugar kinase family protein [Puniceibacterium sediminis]SNR56928.1 Uncharacterized conserved protein YgbK, DUF1537 family [Puniceibacterium sediminis]
MTRVLILAGDLTGALDSAAAFAARGSVVRVGTGPGHLAQALADPSVAVVSVATSTREMDSASAVRVIRAMSEAIQRFDGLLFMKVDSRLKGNIASELADLSELRPGPVLACPAIPRLGRVVIEGAVTGVGVDAPIPIAPKLGKDATIIDAESDADLDAALPANLGGILYLGAAGLAEALARRLVPSPVARPAIALESPLLMAIGSRNPITLEQVAALDLPPVCAPGGRVPTLDKRQVQLIQITQGTVKGHAPEVGSVFARRLALEMRRSMPSTLFVCGGETAAALLHRLDIGLLDHLGEVLSGVPIARCPDSGLTVITKSGGFGDASLLKRLVNIFAKPG